MTNITALGLLKARYLSFCTSYKLLFSLSTRPHMACQKKLKKIIQILRISCTLKSQIWNRYKSKDTRNANLLLVQNYLEAGCLIIFLQRWFSSWLTHTLSHLSYGRYLKINVKVCELVSRSKKSNTQLQDNKLKRKLSQKLASSIIFFIIRLCLTRTENY